MECQHQKRDCEQVSEGHPSLANSSLPLELLNRDTVIHKFHLEKTNKRKQPPETTCGDGSVPWQSIQGMSGNTRTVCDKKELPAHSSQHLTVPVTMAKSVQTQTTIPTKCSADVAVGTSGIEDRNMSKSTQTSPAAVKMHKRTEAIHLGDVQDSGSHMEDSRGVPNVDWSTGFATLDCSQVDRDCTHRTCIVQWCKNTSRTSHARFFRVPKDSRMETFLKFSGRQDLMALPRKKVSNYRICSAHFTDGDFLDPAGRRLVWSAVPTVKVSFELFKSKDDAASTAGVGT